MEKKKLIEQLEKLSRKKVIFEGNEGDLRIILPKMIGVSNNSRLTQTVARDIVKNLDNNQLRDFIQWLNLIR